MSPRHRAALISTAVVFSACSSGSNRSTVDSTAADQRTPADSATAPAVPGDVSVEPFVEACLATTNIGRPTCECTARKARAQLSPNGFAFLTATLRKEDAKAADLRSRLAVQEAMAAGTFMVRGPAECAREAGTAPRRPTR